MCGHPSSNYLQLDMGIFEWSGFVCGHRVIRNGLGVCVWASSDKEWFGCVCGYRAIRNGLGVCVWASNARNGFAFCARGIEKLD